MERVLLLGRGSDVEEALKNSYKLSEKVSFDGAYRKHPANVDLA